jgi:hypothetical protein
MAVAQAEVATAQVSATILEILKCSIAKLLSGGHRSETSPWHLVSPNDREVFCKVPPAGGYTVS